MAICKIPITDLPVSGGLDGSEIIPVVEGPLTKQSELSELSGFVNLQYVTDSNNTTTTGISTNATIITNVLSATEIHTLSSFTKVLDIKQFELSGFEVTGSISVSGDIDASQTITANKVGINTTQPNKALTVHGDVSAIGDIITNKITGREEKNRLTIESDPNSPSNGSIINLFSKDNNTSPGEITYRAQTHSFQDLDNNDKVIVGLSGAPTFTVFGDLSSTGLGNFNTLNVDGGSSTGSINADGNIGICNNPDANITFCNNTFGYLVGTHNDGFQICGATDILNVPYPFLPDDTICLKQNTSILGTALVRDDLKVSSGGLDKTFHVDVSKDSVGINTLSADEALTVNGNISASGTLSAQYTDSAVGRFGRIDGNTRFANNVTIEQSLIVNKIQSNSESDDIINIDSQQLFFRDFDSSPNNLLVIKKFDGSTGANIGINKDPSSSDDVTLQIHAGQSVSTSAYEDALKVVGETKLTGDVSLSGNLSAVGDIFTNKITGREEKDSLILESDPEAPDGSRGGSQIELYSQDFAFTPSQIYHKARFHTFQDLSGGDKFIIGGSSVKSNKNFTVVGDLSTRGSFTSFNSNEHTFKQFNAERNFLKLNNTGVSAFDDFKVYHKDYNETVLSVDISNHRVGINKEFPNSTLHVVNSSAAAGNYGEAIRAVGNVLLTSNADTALIIQGDSNNVGNDDEPLIKLRRGTLSASEGFFGINGKSNSALTRYEGALPEAVYIQSANNRGYGLSAENIQLVANEKIGITVKGDPNKDVKVGILTNLPNEALTVNGNISGSNSLFVSNSATFNGNVGIGNTSPNKTLTVTGDVSATGEVRIDNCIQVCGGLVDNMTFTAGRVSGRVGINTPVPSHTLHITETNAGNVVYPLKIANDSSVTGTGTGIAFGVKSSNAGTSAKQAMIQVEKLNSTAISDMVFSNQADGGGITEKMRIHSDTGLVTVNNALSSISLSANNVIVNDNLGIGTNTPDKLLVVKGADAEIAINDTNSTPLLRLRENGTTKSEIKTSSGSLIFTSGGSTERMRIASDGDVTVNNSLSAGSLSAANGFTGSGTFTNFTIQDGIIIAATT